MAELIASIHAQPLESLTREGWDAIREQLSQAFDTVQRKDADQVFDEDNFMHKNEEHDPQITQAYSPRVKSLTVLISVHMALAPVRATLEEAVHNKSKHGPKVRAEVLKDVL